MPAKQSYDAIIIGAGVIGACIAFELAKKGWKTLSIDKLPEAGYGSTSGSCAIIRTYYSALESCAIAYEGWHYWKDWETYIGVPDEQGLIKYHNTGCLVVKTEHNHHLGKVCSMMDRIGCAYEDVAAEDIGAHMPNADIHQFEPAKRRSPEHGSAGRSGEPANPDNTARSERLSATPFSLSESFLCPRIVKRLCLATGVMDNAEIRA